MEYLPRFREADVDGLVGLRGYMYYFQDAATLYMHNLHLGNDTLPEKYGLCWVYTKYKLHILRRVGFTAPLSLECWAENKKSSVRVYQDLEITQCGQLCAVGRLEQCLLDMKKQQMCRLSAIEWDGRFTLNREVTLGAFTRLKGSNAGSMHKFGIHVVGYTDLDKSGHMNNLRYVDVVLNAFDSAFWASHEVFSFEIHYLNQCYEGETLSLVRCFDGSNAEVWMVKEDGKTAAVGLFELRVR